MRAKCLTPICATLALLSAIITLSVADPQPSRAQQGARSATSAEIESMHTQNMADTDRAAKALRDFWAKEKLLCLTGDEMAIFQLSLAKLTKQLDDAIAIEASLDPDVHKLNVNYFKTGEVVTREAYNKVVDEAQLKVRRRLGLVPEPSLPPLCQPTNASDAPGGKTEPTPPHPPAPPAPPQSQPPGATPPPPSATPTPPPPTPAPPKPAITGPTMICPHCGLVEPRPEQEVSCPDCGEVLTPPAKAPTRAVREATTDKAAAKVNTALDALLKDCTDEKNIKRYQEAVEEYNRAFDAEALGDPDVAEARALRDAMNQKSSADHLPSSGLSDEEKTTSDNATTRARRDFARELGNAETRIRTRIKKLVRIYERTDCPPPASEPPPPKPEKTGVKGGLLDDILDHITIGIDVGGGNNRQDNQKAGDRPRGTGAPPTKTTTPPITTTAPPITTTTPRD